MSTKRITDYYNDIIELKNGQIELDELASYNDNGANLMKELNSESKVSIWRLWVWIIATLTWMQAQSVNKHKLEVEDSIRNNAYGTMPFYKQKVLEFQFGYFLIWNGKQYVYKTEDQLAKIVKRCSVSMHNKVLRFKVTKENSGNLIPLSLSEQSALKDYIGDIIAPGINYAVISSPADLLKLILKIYVNPQVISLIGENLTDGQMIVENTINNFCDNLPFDGRLSLMKLVDQLQEIKGVEDIELLNSSYKYGSLDWMNFTRQIIPFSGHMNLDIINSNITYHEYL